MQGERLGPYLIDRELGAGGMGKVYAATVAERAPGFEIGAIVALKVVHPHLMATKDFFERFMREAQLGQSIEHENVVRTLDCEVIGSSHFLVMEYVEGQTLAALQVALEKVPEELCRHVAREICKGLAAIHGAGVVHRDLKPENVLITEDHIVKVMDLGVARLTDESIRLSQSGAFVGSVEYAAPEQFGGDDVDGRCDLHAFGLLLYELSTGQHPYRGGTFHEVLGRILNEEPRRLGDVNPQLSAFFEELVHKLLAKSREDRFQSAAELLSVLEEGEDSAWWRERAREIQATTKRPIRRIRIPRETAVYGREKEIATLRALYEKANSGDGQVVLLEGEAGVGKSRLVDEFLSRLHADGEDLNFLFGSYPPGGAATAAGGFSSAYREQFGDVGSAEYLTQTPLLVPAFDAVLRGEPSPIGVVELTNDSLGTCFVHATRNLAAERPTVVLIDDLHFAPEDARSLFAALAMAAPGHRVLLIGTMRPGMPEEWVANSSRLDQTSRLDVSRLGPKDLGLLVADSFNSSGLAHSIGVQIAVKSDGNPFFAFEIIRGLREGQFITQKADGSWVSTQIIEEIQIPSSILDLVNARVSKLTDDERNLLDVASCWGFEFDASLVGEALGLRRLPVLQAMAKIEKRDRLVRASGRAFVFDHHQVQEALYSSLPEMLREEYHAALAHALEARTKAADTSSELLDGALCVDICEQYLRGTRGESALRYLEAAQTHLSKGYLHAQMITLTERALAIPDLLAGTDRAKALLRLAAALNPLGRRQCEEEAACEAERLAEETGDERLRGQAAKALGVLFSSTARQAEAEAAFRRALEIARARGDKKAEANAMGNLGNVFHSLGRLPEAVDHHERHLAVSREIGDTEGEAKATGNLGGVLFSMGRLTDAQELFERDLALSREIGNREGEARAPGNIGNVLHALGRFSEALEHYERNLTLSREIGDREGEASALGNVGVIFRCLGRLPEAQEHFEWHLALSREIGNTEGEASAMGNLGNIAWALGRLPEAREHHERHLALSREIGNRAGEAIALHNLSEAERDAGERAKSEKHLVASLAVCEEIGQRYVEAASKLALGSLRCGGRSGAAGDGAAVDEESGRELLAAARDLAAEVGASGCETLARCELALLPTGDAQDALAAFAEHEGNLDGADRRSARLLLWRATGDRAHLEDAKRLLDESLATVPEDHHESILKNRRVNRAIMAAWDGGRSE